MIDVCAKKSATRNPAYSTTAATATEETTFRRVTRRTQLEDQRRVSESTEPEADLSSSAIASGGAFQPLEKDVILNVVLAALHSHQNFAARQSANRLLHDADARGRFAQAFAELAAHRGRKDVRDATGDQLQNRAIERWQTLPGSLQSGVVVDLGSGVRQSCSRTLGCIGQVAA